MKRFSVLHCPWSVGRYGGAEPLFRLLQKRSGSDIVSLRVIQRLVFGWPHFLLHVLWAGPAVFLMLVVFASQYLDTGEGTN